MSCDREENVVKPPQNPVISRIFMFVEIRLLFSTNPKSTPIIKLPTRFTVNVPHGKTPV